MPIKKSYEVYLIGYSTIGYYQRHSELNASARKFGISNILSFHDTDLEKTEFYKANQNIFSIPRGAGLWLWKPYYISETLKKLNYGDMLLYVDAASILINSPAPLFEIAERNESGVITFDKRPLTNRMYCKRDVFVNLNCDEPKCWDAYQSIATMLIFKKTAFSVDFVGEWLEACLNPFSLVNDRVSNQWISPFPSLEGFVDHREDQSILSVLVAKYGLETYRSPVIWGNYLKLPEFRVAQEHVCYPYDYMRTIPYSSTPMKNSPYGTIFIINRGKDPTRKEIIASKFNIAKDLIKRMLRKIRNLLRNG